MNVKKIIKGIIGLGAIGGVAYAAYKLGESDGRFNEIHRRMTENGDEDDEDIEVEEDDDYRFYDNYDEPDDGCIAPIDFGKMNDAPAEKYEDSKCCSADIDPRRIEKVVVVLLLFLHYRQHTGQYKRNLYISLFCGLYAYNKGVSYTLVSIHLCFQNAPIHRLQ